VFCISHCLFVVFTCVDAFDADKWVPKQVKSTTSPFIQYALAATKMALDDANWNPSDENAKCRTGINFSLSSFFFIRLLT
jgi:3-oxoacyl-(acyl-carrier-protein) synthase